MMIHIEVNEIDCHYCRSINGLQPNSARECDK